MDALKNKIKSITPSDESLKVLMITHKVLAKQQGYERLLNILSDSLRDKQDPFLLFFMNTIEPIYDALNKSNMQLLFDALGVRRYPITKKAEKAKWKELELLLASVRVKKAIDILKVAVSSDLIPIPPQVQSYLRLYRDAPKTIYASDATIQEFLELEYDQFLSAIKFLYPEAEFSTEHGVKGEEYDNIVFVISRGWNQYKFETYAPMINGTVAIPKGKESSYERNRNLFYVCCSRPKKRLIMFVTVPIDSAFRNFLTTLVGANNIFTYMQFLDKSEVD